MSRPSSAIIDLQALRDNFSLAQSLAPNSRTMPMVKANAYGHGMLAVAEALADRAPAFGVACIEEALELRAAAIEQPILLLEGTFSADEVPIAARENFWLMVENHQQVAAIIEAQLETPVNVWIKVDTGMHRLGFTPEQTPSVFQQLQASANVDKTLVIATHFAWADNRESEFTAQQIDRFEATVGNIDHSPIATSLANSAAILNWPQAQSDWQRPGYMLYGISPFKGPQANADKLKPVMTFNSAIISVRQVRIGESVGYTANWTAPRDSRIATVCVGYGDGYPRHTDNGTPVLIKGQRCPLVGRVSMDMITVDITDLPSSISIGEPVTLWGPQLPVNEVAEYCGTIGYELLTRMPARVPRIYRN
ncbi:MAG: alanine racemase [Porticoccaceae bacterium]